MEDTPITEGKRNGRMRRTEDSNKRAKRPVKHTRSMHKETQVESTLYDRREQGPIGARGNEGRQNGGQRSPQTRHAQKVPGIKQICMHVSLREQGNGFFGSGRS